VAGYSVQKVREVVRLAALGRVAEVVRLAALGRVAEVVRLAALGRVAEVVAGLDFVPVVVVSDLAESANINLGS
jgi:hypothetical protein